MFNSAPTPFRRLRQELIAPLPQLSHPGVRLGPEKSGPCEDIEIYSQSTRSHDHDAYVYHCILSSAGFEGSMPLLHATGLRLGFILRSR